MPFRPSALSSEEPSSSQFAGVPLRVRRGVCSEVMSQLEREDAAVILSPGFAHTVGEPCVCSWVMSSDCN